MDVDREESSSKDLSAAKRQAKSARWARTDSVSTGVVLSAAAERTQEDSMAHSYLWLCDCSRQRSCEERRRAMVPVHILEQGLSTVLHRRFSQRKQTGMNKEMSVSGSSSWRFSSCRQE